ncbi:hypothetical protein QJQ45_025021 [Haematococcus lacustris]|nr:hypothetical protein QJQ45_025021 [Haematococcus lacustris]
MPGSLDEAEFTCTERSASLQKNVKAPVGLRQQVFLEVKEFFLDTKLNLLLLALPVAIISKNVGWGDGPTFVLSMLALCPLAERLGFITEQLAMCECGHTNDTLGGLLNASFGNATEVIISGFALSKGYLRIVQLSLLGSVVSNLLLVLGSAFIAGGVKQTTQRFNQQGINVNCGLLMVGTLAVILPSLLSETKTEAKEGNTSELALSRFESIFLLLCYACYLLFQLVTHRFLYEEGSEETSKKSDVNGIATQNGHGPDVEQPGEPQRAASGRPSPQESEPDKRGLSNIPAAYVITSSGVSSGRETELTARRGPDGRTLSGRPLADGPADQGDGGSWRGKAGTALDQTGPTGAPGSRPASATGTRAGSEGGVEGGEEEEEEEETPVLSKVGSFIWLALVTALIALLSEWIMDAIKGASKQLRVPMPFLVTILLPIVGNAAEHASAIVFAFRNRIEIALGVAVGSSTQIGVLVVPFCVVLAWMMGQPLDLNFNAFEACVYFFSVLLAAVTVIDGTANWLKGVLLLVTYVLVAAGFWMHKDVDLALENVDAA